MSDSAYYESLGIFFNGNDAEAFAGALEREGLPFRVEYITFEDRPDEILAVEIHVKKSAAGKAEAIKKEIIRATLDNPDVYLHHISDEDLQEIPLHPEDANDFDYWAALELIRQKGLPLEDRNWEAFRQERILEILDQRRPKQSGLLPLAGFIWVLGAVLLAATYTTLPYISLLFFLGSALVARHLLKHPDEFDSAERKKGRFVLWISILGMLAALWFSYRALLG